MYLNVAVKIMDSYSSAGMNVDFPRSEVLLLKGMNVCYL